MQVSKRQIDGWTIKANHSHGSEQEAEWLLSYFEEMRVKGISFFHGMKIRWGWSVLELRNDEQNSLCVYEPDFLKNPMVDIRPDVSVTLQVQAAQVALVNQLQLTPLEVSFQDKIIFAKGSMNAAKVYMERVAPQPEKSDSGWFVGFVDGNNNQENLQAVPVFQLLFLRPMLLQLLLLPAGYMAVLDGDRLEAVIDDQGNSIVS